MAYFQAKNLWVNQLADGVAELVLDVSNSSQNLLTPSVIDDLENAIEAVSANGQFRRLLIRSGKPGSFCHGISLDYLSELETPEDFIALSERGQRVCRKLETLAISTVAFIAGACTGAGLEL